MDFRLTEMQADIANLARDFAEKRLVPTVKERDEKETFDRSILDEMGQLGLLGIPWAEEDGGVGADFLSLAVACEEIAKVDPSIALSFEVHTMLLADMEIRYARTESEVLETTGGRHQARRVRTDGTQCRHGCAERQYDGGKE